MGKVWLNESEGTLNDFLSQINLKNVDSDIRLEIKKYKNILELKSLDATHLATATYIRKMISEDLTICTLDDKFRNVSKKFEFNLLPKSMNK
ncbi:toxin-antitoxin system, toxin component, PIN family [Leptospira interrogans serovar Djasiman str. LT1649]|nr:toxin-antitoxin system, toxin component, PIN family [Leptospira interrogans serovar Djasiman str. LT1649]